MGKNNNFVCYESTLNFKSILISRYRQGMFCYCWAGTDASGTGVCELKIKGPCLGKKGNI